MRQGFGEYLKIVMNQKCMVDYFLTALKIIWWIEFTTSHIHQAEYSIITTHIFVIFLYNLIPLLAIINQMNTALSVCHTVHTGLVVCQCPCNANRATNNWRMTNFSVSFIIPFFFLQMLSNGNKQLRNKQYSTCPDLLNTEKSLSLPINANACPTT